MRFVTRDDVSASVINSVAPSFRIFLGSQKLPCFLTFSYPVPVPKNCVIFIGSNFESRASQVELQKQKKDTASAKGGSCVQEAKVKAVL